MLKRKNVRICSRRKAERYASVWKVQSLQMCCEISGFRGYTHKKLELGMHETDLIEIQF